ncbi:MAG: C-type lectin domain-containing protein [Ferruginibacter sp.]|nr:C-type lectin domain-containing protein [Ferruginibacter sp.]
MITAEILKKRKEHADSTFVHEDMSYVLVYRNPKSWENARSYARLLGGELATIPNDIVNTLCAEQLIARKLTTAWIGLTDQNEERNFSWVSGAPLTYTHWLRREPNNRARKPADSRGEDHVVLHSNYGWNDHNGYEDAGHYFPFFVEYSNI